MESFSTILFDPFSIYLFIAGIATGFVGAMGGAGGLILVPFMIAHGMHPAVALGTARFAAMPAWIIAVSKFSKNGHVRWKEFPLLMFLSVLAGVIGTYLIIDIDEKYVYPIVGTILVLISPLGFLKESFGLVSEEKGKKSTFLGYLFYFLAMVYGGFFGAGSGIITLFILVSLLGFRVFEAHATQKAAWIIMSIFSSAIFIYHDQVIYSHALVIFISMAIGSYIGSHIALKGGDKWIKLVVCLFAFIIGVKLLVWG